MTKKSFRILRAVCFGLAYILSTAAFGWKIVFDPTNFVQNTSSAIAAVKTETTTAAQYAQDLKQTAELLKSNASLGGLTGLARTEQELQAFQDLIAVNTRLKGSMETGLTLMQDMQAGFGASNHSWDTYLQRTATNDIARADAYRGQFEQINRNMVETSSLRKEILERLDSAQGQTAATQALGAQIDVLIGQQQYVINQLGTTKQTDEYKIREEKARADAYKEYNKRIQQEMRDSSGRFITTYGK